MGAIYLTEMANVLRAAGLTVVEEPDWQFRSRSSGGFDFNPLAVFWHHTASNTSAQNDVAYMTYNSDVAPIANIYPADDGRVYVMAGGATNTNGKGNSKSFSRGTVPADQANSHVVGMEIGNSGVGENYTQAQLDAAFIASNAINAWLGNQPDDVMTHQDYAPDRKIDPATASAAAAGGWGPDSVTSSGTWSLASLKQECLRRAGGGGTPPPQPPPSSYNPPTDWGLFPLDCNKPTVRNGDRNDHVRYLQDVIWFYAGGDITRDGIFGNETEKRTKDVQRVFGFPEAYIDGICGWDGPNCQSAGSYATWEAIDFLRGVGSQPPPPVEPPPTPPPTDGVTRTPDAWYYVRSGDSPWGAAERIWGDGTRNGELPPEMFAEPNVWWRVPGVPGSETTVAAGDSPWSLTEKLGGNPGNDLDRFYDFNGGESKVPQPGEPAYLPDAR